MVLTVLSGCSVNMSVVGRRIDEVDSDRIVFDGIRLLLIYRTNAIGLYFGIVTRPTVVKIAG